MKDSVHLNSCVVPQFWFEIGARAVFSLYIRPSCRGGRRAGGGRGATGRGGDGLPVIGGRQALTAKTNRQALTPQTNRQALTAKSVLQFNEG